MKIEIKGIPGHVVAKKMLWMAWQACGGPIGMGRMQDNPLATEDSVWDAMGGARDYGGAEAKRPECREVAADYVFGRMMKLYFTYSLVTDAGNAWVAVSDTAPHAEYQGWFSRFPTYELLAHTAITVCQAGVRAGA